MIDTASPNSNGFSPDEMRSLNQLAVSGLVSMFDSERKLFCRRLVRTPQGLLREGPSRRYTLISVLGLQGRESSGERCPLDTRLILAGLLQDTRWLSNLGDLGLLLWACAEAGPEFSARAHSSFDLEHSLRAFREGRRACTMELAWFLAGISHLHLAGQDHLRDIATRTYELLKQNQGDFGLFGHLAEKRSFFGLMRGRVGSFADQIYSVYALAKFAQSFDARKASERALDCALTLCELQGPLGQWWWHYDAATGKVLSRYPVFSVHQYALAPMALFALGEAAQSDFRVWIHKGVRWIFGDNELEHDLRDFSANVIWDSLRRRDGLRHLRPALEVLSVGEDTRPHKELAPVWECSPDQLGWLLFAWAGESRRARDCRLQAGSSRTA